MDKMSLFPEIPNTLTPPALEALMDEIGLTTRVLAARLDVDPKTVGRWLRGDVPIPGAVALLMRVAHDIHRLSHRWGGHGIAAQDMPSKRVV